MNLRLIFAVFFFVFLTVGVGCKKDDTLPEPQVPDIMIPETSETVFAFIGDYGHEGAPAQAVADMVKSWQPEFIVTSGDNNYSGGNLWAMRSNISQYYGDYIYNPDAPQGYRCTGQADLDAENRFFPSPGNHDYEADINNNYLKFFTLSGNERRYDFRKGAVHFFSMDSNVTSDFAEMRAWLEGETAASDALFKVVIFHHPPFSASEHGSFVPMQWDWAELGICAVLTGHEHTYQHVIEKANPTVHHIVNGLGGRRMFYDCAARPLDENLFDVNCFTDAYGAVKAVADAKKLTFSFYSKEDGGTLIDEVVIDSPF